MATTEVRYVRSGDNASTEQQYLKVVYSYTTTSTTATITATLYAKRDSYSSGTRGSCTYKLGFGTSTSATYNIANTSSDKTIGPNYVTICSGSTTINLANSGASATTVYMYAYLYHNYSSKLQNLAIPKSSSYDGTVTYVSGSNSFTIPAQTSACGAPTSVTASGIIKSDGSFTVSWSGATNGINNKITSYQVYWRITSGGTAPTTSTYTGAKNVTVTSGTTSGSTTISVSSATDGYKVVCGVVAQGTAGASYYSGIKTGGSVTINTPPAAPTVSVSPAIAAPGSSVKFTVTAGADKDGQSCSIYYSTTSTGTKTKFTSPLSITAQNSRGTTYVYYFWTYDGLEYSSSYTSKSFKINSLPSAPTVSVSKSVVPSGGGNVTFTVTAGSDSDGQTRSVYYARSSSGTKTLVNGSSVTLNITSGNNAVYFWTYDGLEYSSNSTLKTITVNTKVSATLSLGLTEDTYEIGGVDTEFKPYLTASFANITNGGNKTVTCNLTFEYTGANSYQRVISVDLTGQTSKSININLFGGGKDWSGTVDIRNSSGPTTFSITFPAINWELTGAVLNDGIENGTLTYSEQSGAIGPVTTTIYVGDKLTKINNDITLSWLHAKGYVCNDVWVGIPTNNHFMNLSFTAVDTETSGNYTYYKFSASSSLILAMTDDGVGVWPSSTANSLTFNITNFTKVERGSFSNIPITGITHYFFNAFNIAVNNTIHEEYRKITDAPSYTINSNPFKGVVGNYFTANEGKYSTTAQVSATLNDINLTTTTNPVTFELALSNIGDIWEIEFDCFQELLERYANSGTSFSGASSMSLGFTITDDYGNSYETSWNDTIIFARHIESGNATLTLTLFSDSANLNYLIEDDNNNSFNYLQEGLNLNITNNFYSLSTDKYDSILIYSQDSRDNSISLGEKGNTTKTWEFANNSTINFNSATFTIGSRKIGEISLKQPITYTLTFNNKNNGVNSVSYSSNAKDVIALSGDQTNFTIVSYTIGDASASLTEIPTTISIDFKGSDNFGCSANSTDWSWIWTAQNIYTETSNSDAGDTITIDAFSTDGVQPINPAAPTLSSGDMNWNARFISVKFVITATQNNYSSTKTILTIPFRVFNLSPTVSYRQNHLGINTKNVSDNAIIDIYNHGNFSTIKIHEITSGYVLVVNASPAVETTNTPAKLELYSMVEGSSGESILHKIDFINGTIT